MKPAGYDGHFFGLWLTAALFYYISYGGLSYLMYRIGRKFAVGEYYEYCIPVYGWVLLCRCAAVSGWTAAGLFMPVVNLPAAAYLFANLAYRLNKNPRLFGILGITFLVPLILLARSDGSPRMEPAPGRKCGRKDMPAAVYLYCSEGEYQGGEFLIPPQGLVIGCDPNQANIVLNRGDVSAANTAVYPSPEQSDAVILVDLQSTGGTYYHDPVLAAWFALEEPLLLSGRQKHRFRTGYPGAEFVVSIGNFKGG